MDADGVTQAETVAPAAASDPEDGTEQSVMELVEQLGRDLEALVICEARLSAARHRPQLRRAARDGAAAAIAGAALIAAFVLVNASAVLGLSTAMPGWAAALVLAAGWGVVGVVLALFLRARARGLAASRAQDPEPALAEAQQAVRDSLERLAPVITREIALASVPMADDIAAGMVEASGELIENADEIVDAITAEMPGGRVVNQIWDVVLMPGRLGVRVATTVLKR
jgi:hypothetical protein